MIKPWFLPLARGYVRWRLRRAFDGLFVAGEENASMALERGPVIVAANHVSWWDALVILALDARLGGWGRCLMDADNLARMPFFGWVGAVPLDRSSPRASLRDLSAAASRLDRPGSSLWIFPQGRLRPPHLRPFGIQPGVAWLAKKSGAPVIPLSLDYLYREAPQPTIVACYGAPLDSGPDLPGALAESWEASLDRAGAFALSRGPSNDRFVPIVAPRKGSIRATGGNESAGGEMAKRSGERQPWTQS